jgi:serine/threonine-protein kinase
MSANPPATIGRYRIRSELGQGGMGIVYRAFDPNIDREVAIKTLRDAPGLGAAAREQQRERFLNEARAAGRLRHPGIVAVLDADVDPATGLPFLAMELVHGQSLEQELEAGRRFAPAESVAIVAAVADALAYAHRQGVVHRDVKPGNILLEEGGGVRITDFGIARLGESSLTRTGQILGSPAYMSPEQIAGARVDARSDVFSLGVVLYHLLAGERPFQGEALSTLSYQIVHQEPIPPGRIDPTLPASLEDVVLRALAKRPEERWPGAAELAQALRAAAVPAAGAAARRTATGTLVVDAPAAGAGPTGTVTFDLAPAAGRRHGARPWLLTAAVLLGALAAALWLTRSPGPKGGDRAEPPRSPAGAERPGAAVPAAGDRQAEQGERAQLLVDFEHHVERGTVTLRIDGDEVWSGQLKATKKTRLGVPGLKLAHGQLTATIDVPAGKRVVSVTVWSQASGVDDTRSTTIDLAPGRTNLLRIRVDRLTRKVSLTPAP